MSLRNVVLEWINWGCGPGELETLSPDDQRQFVADVIQEDPEWLYDALSETFGRKPGDRVRIVEAFRGGDFLQVGAEFDRALRTWVIETCREFWDAVFTQIREQNSDYAGDE